MKGKLLAVLFFLAGVATAQQPPTISDTDLEKYWSVFIMVDHVPQKARLILQESAGISEDSSTALAIYVAQAMKDLRESAKRSGESICARKNELKASRSALADAVKQSDEQWNAERRGYVTNLGTIMNTEDESKLRLWVAERDGPAVASSENVDAKIRSGELDHQAMLDRSCGESNQ